MWSEMKWIYEVNIHTFLHLYMYIYIFTHTLYISLFISLTFFLFYFIHIYVYLYIHTAIRPYYREIKEWRGSLQWAGRFADYSKHAWRNWVLPHSAQYLPQGFETVSCKLIWSEVKCYEIFWCEITWNEVTYNSFFFFLLSVLIIHKLTHFLSLRLFSIYTERIFCTHLVPLILRWKLLTSDYLELMMKWSTWVPR